MVDVPYELVKRNAHYEGEVRGNIILAVYAARFRNRIFYSSRGVF